MLVGTRHLRNVRTTAATKRLPSTPHTATKDMRTWGSGGVLGRLPRTPHTATKDIRTWGGEDIRRGYLAHHILLPGILGPGEGRILGGVT